eukprot:m.46024 g.46024  ORF g.46024 m.46024 type:complete len:112 (+) comp12499_c0_seq1:228-563(+)
MDPMEQNMKNARETGRLLVQVVGVLLFVVGAAMLAYSRFCFTTENHPYCYGMDEDHILRISYAGAVLVLLFCCAPCFALRAPRPFYEWMPALEKPLRRRFANNQVEQGKAI